MTNTSAKFGYGTNRNRAMRAYDRLPSPVRKALAACDCDISSEQVAELRISEDAAIALISSCDKENVVLLAKEYYGNDHPQVTK
jgi:hypothetical protein